MSNDHYQQLHADALVVDGVCPLLFDHRYLDWYQEGGVDIVTPTVGTVAASGAAGTGLQRRRHPQDSGDELGQRVRPVLGVAGHD